jgi:hypothetical protein
MSAARLRIAPLLLALLGWSLTGCDRGVSSDPSLEPVPVSPANNQAGGAQPTSAQPAAATAAPSTGQLPPNHPPIGAIPTPAPPLPPGTPMNALPPNHPPIGPGQAAALMAGPPASAGPLQWTTPPGWTEQPPSSSMRVAQWALSGAGGDAECAILRLGGGGSVDDNINRWIGQFTQPDGSSSASHAVRADQTVNGLQVTTLELSGTFQTRNPPMSGPVVDMPNYAMFGAIVETSSGPFFLKCTGPEATMTAQHDQLGALVQSFRTSP